MYECHFLVSELQLFLCVQLKTFGDVTHYVWYCLESKPMTVMLERMKFDLVTNKKIVGLPIAVCEHAEYEQLSCGFGLVLSNSWQRFNASQSASTEVTCLWVRLDSQLTFTAHVQLLARRCFCYLRQMWTVRGL